MKILSPLFFKKILRTLGERSSLRFWLTAAIGVCLTFVFFEIADEIMDLREGENVQMHVLDERIMQTVQRLRTPAWNQAMLDLTALGSFSVLTLISILIFSFLVMLRDGRGIVHYAIIIMGAASFPPWLKDLFHRERPASIESLAVVSDTSFPSGHSFAAASIYLTLAFLLSRSQRGIWKELFFVGLALLIILCVGVSRIYLGVHYPSDVLAGWCLGSAWSLLLVIFRLGFETKFSKNV